jgi:hypothetical protein
MLQRDEEGEGLAESLIPPSRVVDRSRKLRTPVIISVSWARSARRDSLRSWQLSPSGSGTTRVRGADLWAHVRSETLSASVRPPGGSHTAARAARGAELGWPRWGKQKWAGLGTVGPVRFYSFLFLFYFLLSFPSFQIQTSNSSLNSNVWQIYPYFILCHGKFQFGAIYIIYIFLYHVIFICFSSLNYNISFRFWIPLWTFYYITCHKMHTQKQYPAWCTI